MAGSILSTGPWIPSNTRDTGFRLLEIESVLQDHPAVIASCVVGIPDQKVGERIKAYVVLKSDVKGITGYDLISYCRQKLTAYKVPQYIEFRDMLPKSKGGQAFEAGNQG